MSRLRGVDIQCEEIVNSRYRCGLVAELYPEHLIKVRSRICTDEKNPLALICQGHGCGTAKGRFSYTPFAGEKKKPRRTPNKAGKVQINHWVACSL